MKVKLTIEKVYYENRIVEIDNKFKICADPDIDVLTIPTELFEEAANAAAEAANLPLYGEEPNNYDLENGVIVAGECVDNGELIFEI